MSSAYNHQPGEARFKAILPEDIVWRPFDAFPVGVHLAIVVGHPSEPGPYVIRVKVPFNIKLMPHQHPEDRVYTVMSGVFYVGRGERFDGNLVNAYPPGSVIILPGNTPHFHWAKSGEYVAQVTAIGPLGLNYVDPNDDPRNTVGAKNLDSTLLLSADAASVWNGRNPIAQWLTSVHRRATGSLTALVTHLDRYKNAGSQARREDTILA